MLITSIKSVSIGFIEFLKLLYFFLILFSSTLKPIISNTDKNVTWDGILYASEQEFSKLFSMYVCNRRCYHGGGACFSRKI